VEQVVKVHQQVLNVVELEVEDLLLLEMEQQILVAVVLVLEDQLELVVAEVVEL
tara:strand:+ start:393 stop:554 length:162 start_codon:yes stop_codon:yes gene_type:complete